MAIHTVAAGGGSILTYDGARFRAGPDSAGADPGPACYRRGGPLAVTDANVMVGKLSGEFFPHIFGPDADAPLDEDVVRDEIRGPRRRDRRRARAAMRSPTASSASRSRTWPMRSSAFPWPRAMTRANTRSTVSAARAGSMPASSPMRWGWTTIFIHPFSGVLSAYGMKLAALARAAAAGGDSADWMRPAWRGWTTLAAALGAEAARRDRGAGRRAGRAERAGASALSGQRHHAARSAGFAGGDDSAHSPKHHARLFGFGFEGKTLIAESIEVEAVSAATRQPPLPTASRPPSPASGGRRTRRPCTARASSRKVPGTRRRSIGLRTLGDGATH